MKRLSASLLFVLCSLSFADEPPSWHPFTETSENGKIQASVGPISDTVFQLKIEKRMRKSWFKSERVWKTKWTKRYEYDGYTGGLIVNSGKYFIYVDEWFSEGMPIVKVYSKKHIEKIPGKVFVKDSTLLEKTASHYVWLSMDKRPRIQYKNGKEFLIITTRDSVDHEVLLTK